MKVVSFELNRFSLFFILSVESGSAQITKSISSRFVVLSNLNHMNMNQVVQCLPFYKITFSCTKRQLSPHSKKAKIPFLRTGNRSELYGL